MPWKPSNDMVVCVVYGSARGGSYAVIPGIPVVTTLFPPSRKKRHHHANRIPLEMATYSVTRKTVKTASPAALANRLALRAGFFRYPQPGKSGTKKADEIYYFLSFSSFLIVLFRIFRDK